MNYKVISESRHKVKNAFAQEDITYENYLRLAESILTGRVRIQDLQDEVEAHKRMKEIDELRAKGGKTGYEKTTNDNKKRSGNPNLKYKKIVLEVTDLKTNKTITYKSMREFCEVNYISRENIKKKFKKAESDQITYNDLIIKKIDVTGLKLDIEPYRIYLNKETDLKKHKTKWNDEEKAFIAQNRPQMLWRDITVFLGRSAESCSNMLRELKKQNKLDFYKNIDISDKFKL